jgi:hypothetical protein
MEKNFYLKKMIHLSSCNENRYTYKVYEIKEKKKNIMQGYIY